MTYNVFGGMLNLALSIYLFMDAVADALGGVIFRVLLWLCEVTLQDSCT